MKTEFLKNLGLEQDAINQIMAEYGKSVAKYQTDANTIATLKETEKTLREQLGEANKQIEDFKGMDIEAIKKSADEWKKKAEEADKNAAQRIAEFEHDSLLREKLGNVKFTSEYAKKGVFDEIKGKGLTIENGQILGFDDALSAIREAQPTAFEPDVPPPAFSTGAKPPENTNINAVRSAMGLPPEKG